MSYHKNDCEKFILSRKTLDDETIESITTFFQALFEQKKLNGTIEHQEADPIRRRLLCKASEKRCGRIREASDGQCSQRARREIALCNNLRRYLDEQGDRSHRCCTCDNRDGNDRRPSYGVSKRYRGKCPACDGCCPCNNQPREQKSLAGRKKDGTGKSTPCKMHSYPGHPAKYSWAECSENPANQKKPTAKRAEAYYAHDERCPASNTASLSNHRTVLVSDKSNNEYSSRSDYSNDEDNFAVAISAVPCKQAKHKALPPKKELAIAMSESDDDINNNGVSAKLCKLEASYTTAPSVGKKHLRSKDAQCNPLSLPDSN